MIGTWRRALLVDLKDIDFVAVVAGVRDYAEGPAAAVRAFNEEIARAAGRCRRSEVRFQMPDVRNALVRHLASDI